MRNINEVMLSGNLVKEAAVRKTEAAVFADFMLASNRKARQVEGKWQQNTDFIPVTSSGKIAERMAEVPKGSCVTLRGCLESYSYQKEEQTVRGIRVRAQEIISIEKKGTAVEEEEEEEVDSE